jgi:acyl-CoA hydrolase
MDKHGGFTFGTTNDYISSVARQATTLIVEVNPNMPRVFGASILHGSEVNAITEGDARLDGCRCDPSPTLTAPSEHRSPRWCPTGPARSASARAGDHRVREGSAQGGRVAKSLSPTLAAGRLPS